MYRKVFILLPLLVGLSIPLFSHNTYKENDDGGVFICEDTGEKGPIFYPASYSSDITNEPKYSTQNTLTFESMNFDATPTYYRGDSVKVAVIDSGLNYTHEDFIDTNSNQIIQGHSRTIDNKSGSWLYYQFSSGYQTRINDTLGHGTNVASVIASQINSIGCAGIAPNVELYVYKVTNDNDGYEWTAINSALQYCIDEGIDVINMSFQAYEHAVSYNGSTMGASTGCSSVMTTYLNNCYNAGITLVAAAGNFNTSEPSYPASNNHVISVGSLAKSSTTTKAGFSNTYGIDLVAPGYVYVAEKGNSNAYKETQGTSFSAPIVTAAIALYKQKYPSATPAQIEQALYDSCDAIAGNPSWAGNGRLNIDRFLGVSTGMPQEINWTNVDNDLVELEIGDTFQLQCEVLPNDAINKTVHYQVDEDLSEEGVCTVTDSGLITATGVGTAFIEVYSDEITSVNNYVEVSVTSTSTYLSSISIKTAPTKVTYVEGNTFDPTGLVITAHYNNSTSEDISYASHSGDFSFSPSLATALTTSNTSVSITYGGKSCNQAITVNEKSLSSITISGYKTAFVKGDTFSFGGTVTAHYDNGTTSSVTGSATFTGYDMSVTGNQEVTVSYTYKGVTKTAKYQITVSASTSTLVITRSSFATSGGYAWYDWSEDGVSGKGELYTTTTTSMQFNKSKGSSVAALFNTTPISGSITKISAKTASGTNRSWSAYVTSTACSASGSTLTFGNNKTTVGSNVTITTNLTQIGTTNAGYSYFCVQENDSSASYLENITITYIPKSISSIAVKTAPSKVTYESGETFDPTGLVITVTYSDSTTEDVVYSGNETKFSFSPSTSTALTTGDNSVTITYGEKTCSQSISVTTAVTLTSISISGQTTSLVEGDSFSFGGTVTATYSNDSHADVTSSATFTGYDMTVVGNHTVTVSYTYKDTTRTASYTLTINAGTLSSISLSEMTTTYTRNSAFSFNGTCTAHFANGYEKVVTPTSVSSPDMSTSGNKTITISYTYNDKTVSTTYQITVNAYRTVMEEQTNESLLGSVTYQSNTQTATSGITVTTGSSGYTAIESNAIRLGSGSKTGTVTVTYTSASIYKVVVSAKSYGSDSGVHLTIGGSDNIVTSSYVDYEKTYATPVNSVAIATTANSKRAYVQSITLYTKSTTSVDIGQSDDCVGLETFINNYMHMDYNDNLGYCKDDSHHYYSSAKEAFNALNDHQRSLFVNNSAYSLEYERLAAWAGFNGESLNTTTNKFGSNKIAILDNSDKSHAIYVVVVVSTITISFACCYFLFKKKKS